MSQNSAHSSLNHHALWTESPRPEKPDEGRIRPKSRGLLAAVVLSLTACGNPAEDTGSLQGAATTDLTSQWQPFTSTSMWNMKLPPNRPETPLNARGLATGPFDASDGSYGI